jgi:hypothetical protein
VNRPSPPPEAAKLLEAALDVFVYAPIGFVLDAREVVPKLAERGRGQVTLARLFGRYALSLGQAEAERVLNLNRQRDEAASSEPPVASSEPPVASTEPEAGPTATATTESDEVATPPRATTAPAPAPPVADAPAADELPIPGYDTLSASQVVPRLDALLPHELEAVRAYETAHRGRRTILNRIAQRLA